MSRGDDDDGPRLGSRPRRAPGPVVGRGGPPGADPVATVAPLPTAAERAVVDRADVDRAGTDRAGAAADDATTARLEMEQIEMARVDLAPIDLASLNADDELIDALAAGRLCADDLFPEPVGPDDELVAMLAAWVVDVAEPEPLRPAADPEPSAPIVQPASAEVARGRTGGVTATTNGTTNANATSLLTAPTLLAPRPSAVPIEGHGRHRVRSTPYGTRLAAAATLFAVASSGVVLGSRDANPGEALWTVSKVFYTERARSVEAAAEVTGAIQQAHVAIGEGRTADAAQAIALVSARLPLVRPDEGHDQLASQHRLLLDELAAISGGRPIIPRTSVADLPTAPTGGALAAPQPTGAPVPTTVVLPTIDPTPDPLTAAAPTDGAAIVAQQATSLAEAIAAAVETAVQAGAAAGDSARDRIDVPDNRVLPAPDPVLPDPVLPDPVLSVPALPGPVLPDPVLPDPLPDESDVSIFATDDPGASDTAAPSTTAPAGADDPGSGDPGSDNTGSDNTGSDDAGSRTATGDTAAPDPPAASDVVDEIVDTPPATDVVTDAASPDAESQSAPQDPGTGQDPAFSSAFGFSVDRSFADDAADADAAADTGDTASTGADAEPRHAKPVSDDDPAEPAAALDDAAGQDTDGAARHRAPEPAEVG